LREGGTVPRHFGAWGKRSTFTRKLGRLKNACPFFVNWGQYKRMKEFPVRKENLIIKGLFVVCGLIIFWALRALSNELSGAVSYVVGGAFFCSCAVMFYFIALKFERYKDELKEAEMELEWHRLKQEYYKDKDSFFVKVLKEGLEGARPCVIDFYKKQDQEVLYSDSSKIN